MSKLKPILYSGISLLLCLFAGCHSVPEGTATISGTLKDAAGQKLYLYRLLPGDSPIIDSTITDSDGNFSLQILPEQKSIYLLRPDGRNSITLAVGRNDRIMIEGNGMKLPETYTVTGSEDSKVFRDFSRISSRGRHQLDSLSKILNESQSMEDFPAIRRKLDAAFQEVFETSRKEVVTFLESRYQYLASAILVNYRLGDTPLVTMDNDISLFQKIDTALSAKYSKEPNYRDFHDRLLSFSKTNQIQLKTAGSATENKTIPAIRLNDRNGKPCDLSCSEKYTLVYFWASWKPESRDLTNNLVGLYERFHGKGFGIYSISLDEDKMAWINAIQRDRVSWTQVNDPAGLKSENAKMFGVSRLPELFLLNEKRQIISSDITLPGLKAFLLEKL